MQVCKRRSMTIKTIRYSSHRRVLDPNATLCELSGRLALHGNQAICSSPSNRMPEPSFAPCTMYVYLERHASKQASIVAASTTLPQIKAVKDKLQRPTPASAPTIPPGLVRIRPHSSAPSDTTNEPDTINLRRQCNLIRRQPRLLLLLTGASAQQTDLRFTNY